MLIALVDDDKATNFLNSHLFKQSNWEYTVKTFSNGKQILESDQLFDFDFILLDVNMPVMGGLEFLSKLKELNKTAYPRIVLVLPDISDHNFDAIQKEFPFVVSHIHKPLRAEHINDYFTV